MRFVSIVLYPSVLVKRAQDIESIIMQHMPAVTCQQCCGHVCDWIRPGFTPNPVTQEWHLPTGSVCRAARESGLWGPALLLARHAGDAAFQAGFCL